MNWSPDDLPGFFERLRNMSAIRRFGTLPSAQHDSVANHSFDVAVLSIVWFSLQTAFRTIGPLAPDRSISGPTVR